MPLYALGARRPQLDPQSWVAPNAIVIGDVRLARNASIWWNTTLRGDNDPISIGENSNIQDNCVLHTDEGVPLSIGRDVTVGHLVMLHGCTIGDGSLIGIQAVVLNGARTDLAGAYGYGYLGERSNRTSVGDRWRRSLRRHAAPEDDRKVSGRVK